MLVDEPQLFVGRLSKDDRPTLVFHCHVERNARDADDCQYQDDACHMGQCPKHIVVHGLSGLRVGDVGSAAGTPHVLGDSIGMLLETHQNHAGEDGDESGNLDECQDLQLVDDLTILLG